MILAPSPARAEQSGPASAYPGTFTKLDANLTQHQFTEMTADLNSLMRFRQLGDTRPLGRGTVDLGIQFGSAPIDGWKGPRIVGRFGVNDRVDVGAWGGLNAGDDYGMVGMDVRVALLTEGVRWPVSVSVRPSATALVGPVDILAGTAGFDITVSRTFGAFSPYAGLAATSSIAAERSDVVHLDHATAGAGLSYAGLAYRWQMLVFSAEVERGTKVNYAFRIGTRF
jgi:hypothetical protein